jgi:hypothetical protein
MDVLVRSTPCRPSANCRGYLTETVQAQIDTFARRARRVPDRSTRRPAGSRTEIAALRKRASKQRIPFRLVDGVLHDGDVCISLAIC